MRSHPKGYINCKIQDSSIASLITSHKQIVKVDLGQISLDFFLAINRKNLVQLKIGNLLILPKYLLSDLSLWAKLIN